MTRQDESQFDSLPEALADALHKQDGPPPSVPEQIDRAVLDRAKAQFAQRVDHRAEAAPPANPVGRIGWAKWAGAVAAAIAVGVLTFVAIDAFRDSTHQMLNDLKQGASQPLTLGPGSPAELAWDVDHTGQLNVLDVFILAKRQQAGDRSVTPEILADLTARIVSLDKATATLPGIQPGAVLAWSGFHDLSTREAS